MCNDLMRVSVRSFPETPYMSSLNGATHEEPSHDAYGGRAAKMPNESHQIWSIFVKSVNLFVAPHGYTSVKKPIKISDRKETKTRLICNLWRKWNLRRSNEQGHWLDLSPDMQENQSLFARQSRHIITTTTSKVLQGMKIKKQGAVVQTLQALSRVSFEKLHHLQALEQCQHNIGNLSKLE